MHRGDASAVESAIDGAPTKSAPLRLTSHPRAALNDDFSAPFPYSAPTETQLQRDDWMLAHTQVGSGAVEVGAGMGQKQGNADLRADGVREKVDLDRQGDPGDFFATLGQQRVKKAKEAKPDPEKLYVGSRELNQQLVQGKRLDEYATAPKRRIEFASLGFQWRMMKLRKTYELAEEEERKVEEVALERYGDLDSFNEACEERQWLDDRERNPKRPKSGQDKGPETSTAATESASWRSSFTNAPGIPLGGAGGSSRPVSRHSSFKKPGEFTAPVTPKGDSLGGSATPSRLFGDPAATSAGDSKNAALLKPLTPIPSVFAPKAPAPAAQPSASSFAAESVSDLSQTQAAMAASQARDAISNPPLDKEALNKLEARVLKAEMLGKPNAALLRKKLERERERATGGGYKGDVYFLTTADSVADGTQSSETNIQVLPTLDGRGKLYDVGTSRLSDDRGALPPGNRRRNTKKVETHDPKTGEVKRYNADDDEHTLADLVRQEKFSAGLADQKNFDAEFANRIASDGSFRADFDYLDENVEKLSRKKMRSDALKRQFAINDFAKTKRVLESCRFCWRSDKDGDEECPPQARVIASGTRAYLALPETEPLVEGHVLIVPIQHHLNMLEAEEDVWEEVKNFMKCLFQLAAAEVQDRSYVFYETVISLRQQRHTCIEAVPLGRDLLATLPGHFQVELSSVEGEWSQNKKVIEFSPQKPFRRSMVSQLPYFMVQFDHKGERGYGHVIEGADAGFAEDARGPTSGDGGNSNDAFAGNFSSGAGARGKFEPFFAAELIGSLLDLEPRAWRNPKRLRYEPKRAEELQRAFASKWEPFDWTKMLRK